jgi:hypothetical protein
MTRRASSEPVDVSVREPAYELSARSRALLAGWRGAHDDDAVTFEQFQVLCVRWSREALALPEQDRRQLALAVAEIALRNITGEPRLVLDAIVHPGRVQATA